MPSSPRRLAVALIAAVLCLAVSPSTSRNLSVVDLLDRYAGGRFDEVVQALAGEPVDYGDLLRQLRHDGPGWIASGGPAVVERRELVAATFALEAARAGAWHGWKRIQRQPPMCAGGECYQPPSVLYWDAPPLLIEWACELMRRHETPRPVERWWQLAALAVVQRSEDPQFLIGDTAIGHGLGSAEIGNTQDDIKHLDHVTPRFPDEMRFVLAQGIARDRVWPEDAFTAYGALDDDADVGGEAMMRLGALQLRQRRFSDALRSFERAETLTRDPYVIFLARYFTAQVHERQRRADRAEAAYRDAVAAVPHAQSATVALAALIFRAGRRAEAQHLIGAMLVADPPPVDPWRTFVHADDRFWPQLVARLRWEIRR